MSFRSGHFFNFQVLSTLLYREKYIGRSIQLKFGEKSSVKINPVETA